MSHVFVSKKKMKKIMSIQNFPKIPKITLRKATDEFKYAKNVDYPHIAHIYSTHK